MSETWEMWAGKTKNGYAHISPDKMYVSLFGDESLEQVAVSEQEDGPYWGWVSLEGGEDWPTRIQPREAMFRTQFPYGYENLEEQGRGRMVRLKVEPLNN